MGDAILGVVGCRMGCWPQQMIILKQLIDYIKPKEIHHGDCVGVDAQIDYIAYRRRIPRVIHPPVKRDHRIFSGINLRPELCTILPEKKYFERNKDIVEACDLVLAIPETSKEEEAGGTWFTIRLCRELKRDHYILYPRGVYTPVLYS